MFFGIIGLFFVLIIICVLGQFIYFIIVMFVFVSLAAGAAHSQTNGIE